ncbi:MAG: phosphoribosylglycinamide formyltransferase [Bacteriovorax sp.]|nr:phosphoribosylglycinamide formyltransferase [Bacteriovorax sp.]
MSKIKLAILASGSGSNAEAIMKWAATSDLAEVVCVGCNKKAAMVISRAEIFNIPKFTVLKRKKETRESFDERMTKSLSEYKPDWIILAGYMRLLTEDFLKHFKYQVINIHPSLLPMFPGLDGYGDAFKAGVLESGCTVHYVDAGLDSGEIIDQCKFPLIPGESFEDFKRRGLAIENKFYPEVLEKFFKGFV